MFPDTYKLTGKYYTGKSRIGYMDDDEDFLQLFTMAFSRWFEIVPLLSDTTTMENIKQEHFDLMIIDYDMRELDGLEWLKLIKEELPQLPVILYTGQGSDEVALEAYKSGAADYLIKDYSTFIQLEMMAESILRALSRKKAS